MPAPRHTEDERAALALLWTELGATLLEPGGTDLGELCTGCRRRAAGTFQGRPALCYPCSHAEAYLSVADDELRETLGWTWREFNRYLRRHGRRPARPVRRNW